MHVQVHITELSTKAETEDVRTSTITELSTKAETENLQV